MTQVAGKRVRSSVVLRYCWTAGRLVSDSYKAVRRGQLVGNKCTGCGAVYVPPRSMCPRCWHPCSDEQVPVADQGEIKSFVVITVAFPGQEVDVPYVLAQILLDGADMTIDHIVAVERESQPCVPDGLRVGMRVQARWIDAQDRQGFLNDDIAWFQPIGA